MKYIIISSILVVIIIAIYNKYLNLKYSSFYLFGPLNNSTTTVTDDDSSSEKPYEILGTHYSPLIDESKSNFYV